MIRGVMQCSPFPGLIRDAVGVPHLMGFGQGVISDLQVDDVPVVICYAVEIPHLLDLGQGVISGLQVDDDREDLNEEEVDVDGQQPGEGREVIDVLFHALAGVVGVVLILLFLTLVGVAGVVGVPRFWFVVVLDVLKHDGLVAVAEDVNVFVSGDSLVRHLW